MTIHYTANYGLAFIDVDTALADLAAASAEMAAAADAALTRGGIATPEVAALQDEITLRKNGDAALAGRLDKVEPRVTALETAGNRPHCMAVQTAAQGIAHNTWTTLALGGETLDTNNMHDPATNNSRVTIPFAGTYRVSGLVPFAAAAAVSRHGARVRVNGAVLPQGPALVSAPANLDYTVHTAPMLLQLAAADYVELQALQQSGGSLNTLVTTEARAFLLVECVRRS